MTESAAPSGQLHRIAPLCILVLGVFGIVEAKALGLGSLTNPAPGLWPTVLSILVTVTGLVLLVVDRRSDYEQWTRRSGTVLWAIGTLAAYVVAFVLFGYLPSAVLLLVVYLKVFARESWPSTVLLSLIGGAVLYAVFDLALGVPFPDGTLVGRGF